MVTNQLLRYNTKLDKKVMIGGEPDKKSGKVWFYDIGGESNVKLDDYKTKKNKVFFPTNNFINNTKTVWKGGSIHGIKSISTLIKKDIKQMEKKLLSIKDVELLYDKKDKEKLENKLSFYKNSIDSKGRVVYQHYTNDDYIYVISNKNITIFKTTPKIFPNISSNKVKLNNLSNNNKFIFTHDMDNKCKLYVLSENSVYDEVITDLGNPILVSFRGLKKNEFTNIYPEGFGNTNINKYNEKIIESSRFLKQITKKNVNKIYNLAINKTLRKKKHLSAIKTKKLKKGN